MVEDEDGDGSEPASRPPGFRSPPGRWPWRRRCCSSPRLARRLRQKARDRTRHPASPPQANKPPPRHPGSPTEGKKQTRGEKGMTGRAQRAQGVLIRDWSNLCQNPQAVFLHIRRKEKGITDKQERFEAGSQQGCTDPTAPVQKRSRRHGDDAFLSRRLLFQK